MRLRGYIFLALVLMLNMFASFSVSELLEPMSSADFLCDKSEGGADNATLSIVTPIQKVSFLLSERGAKKPEHTQNLAVITAPFDIMGLAVGIIFITIVGCRVIYSRCYIMRYRHNIDGKKDRATC